jgi:hypothetical protein
MGGGRLKCVRKLSRAGDKNSVCYMRPVNPVCHITAVRYEYGHTKKNKKYFSTVSNNARTLNGQLYQNRKRTSP